MTAAKARRIVALAFESTGAAVYLGAQRPGRGAIPDLVVMDPDTGATSCVRVLVGKRPRRATRLYHDPRREGSHADVLAIVDPGSGAVQFAQPALTVATGGADRRTGVLPGGSSTSREEVACA